jgi:hypothetical protein
MARTFDVAPSPWLISKWQAGAAALDPLLARVLLLA